MNKKLFLLVFCIALISGVLADSQGFTVNSVSLSNILHPGDSVSNTQWLIQLTLNGGGQSLVGTLDNSTINYQGLTSAYPLKISGATGPEEAFYVINNANPQPIYNFSTVTEYGNVSGNILGYLSATEAPSCPSGSYDIYTLIVPAGELNLGTNPVPIARVCVLKQQIGSKTDLLANPNIQFNANLNLISDGKNETIKISQDQKSATSNDGAIQANWVGSLVTGNAAPDGSQYVAINSQSSSSWLVKDLTDFDSYSSQYDSLSSTFQSMSNGQSWSITGQAPINCSQYSNGNSDQNPGAFGSQSSWTQWLNNYLTCLNGNIQSQYSILNQISNSLVSGNSVNIGNNPPQLSSINGQSVFKVPLDNYFVTNPVILLRLSGSFIGVVIPEGKPQILSATSGCFNSGDNGTIKIQVKNVGNSQGSFYASLINCTRVDTQSQPKYSVNPGQTSEIDVPIYTTGTNTNLSESCQVQVTDYNGGGSDSQYITVCMKKAIGIENSINGSKISSNVVSNSLSKSSSAGVIILIVVLVLIAGSIGLFVYNKNKKGKTPSKKKEESSKEKHSGKYCTKCGAPLKEGSNFCAKCGRNLLKNN